MALVTRRYVLVGPTTAMLGRYVDQATAVVAGTYPIAILDVTIDNAVADILVTLDEYMATLGYAFSAAASPKQVFRYVATGAEANPVIIGAAEGFTPRASANYNVQLTMAGPLANAFKGARPLASTYSPATFEVESAVALEAGDVLQFTVEDT
jgi:hypothetical protein